MDNSIYSILVKDPSGREIKMEEFKNHPLLIVNVASKCGFTPQYLGLENLHKKFREKGLIVIGFPCNQFGGQEPGNDSEIQSFCKLTYDVSFPVMAKVDVNGGAEHPLFKYLKSKAPGILGTEGIKWNFTKFLVSKTGEVLDRYAPQTKPEDLEDDIVKAL